MSDVVESAPTGTQWRNWGGNQQFQPAAHAWPRTEDELVDIVADAGRRDLPVRMAGSGHSFTPVVATRGVLVHPDHLSGVLSVDATARRARVLAGTRVADLGEELWQAGLSIANQGDIDAQTIAGACMTATKGSGAAFTNMAARITAMRLAGAAGPVEVDGADADLLAAAQVSLGLLGVASSLELDLVDAYFLREENTVLRYEELLERWDDLLAEYRHFSFWWMPQDSSADLYELGDVPRDSAFVKLLREVDAPAELTIEGTWNSRTGRSYLIYPDGTTEAGFHELEYMVPSAEAKQALAVMRELMVTQWPSEASPVQIRWQRGDSAMLSPQYGRDSVSVSVSGVIGTDYEPFLRAVDHALREFDARPHWGKLHYLDRERVGALYPRYADFERYRQVLDPQGLFLNDHFGAIFGPA